MVSVCMCVRVGVCVCAWVHVFVWLWVCVAEKKRKRKTIDYFTFLFTGSEKATNVSGVAFAQYLSFPFLSQQQNNPGSDFKCSNFFFDVASPRQQLELERARNFGQHTSSGISLAIYRKPAFSVRQ